MLKILIILCLLWPATVLANPYKITVLATNISDYGGLGEWSFSTVFEGDVESVLFDTGFKSDTVLHNVLHLGVDLSQVEKSSLVIFTVTIQAACWLCGSILSPLILKL